MHTLAIDIGTTNIKGVLFGPGAVPVAQATREHGTEYPRPTWAEQRAEAWWSGAVETIRRVLCESGVVPASIGAVAVSGQAPTLLALDAAGKPLAPAIIWMDRRSADQCGRLTREIGAERIYGITGNWPDSFYLLSKLRWFRENRPELADRTAAFLQSNGYINFMLTGERSADAGHASLSQACDLSSGSWSGDLLRAAGFDESAMPRIAASGEVVGRVTARAAALTGLKAGTPVLAGAVDAIGGALEAGILGEGAHLHQGRGPAPSHIGGSDELDGRRAQMAARYRLRRRGLRRLRPHKRRGGRWRRGPFGHHLPALYGG